MPLFMLVTINIGLVAVAAVQCLFRPGVFFGLTVDAHRIDRRYRLPVIVMAVLCTAALWLVVPHLRGVAASMVASSLVFIAVSTGFVSIAVASRRVRRFAQPSSSNRTRTASLVPRKPTLAGGRLPFVGPMLIVGAALLSIVTRRELMPPQAYRRAVVLLLLPFVTNVFYMCRVVVDVSDATD
jgi:hypothetical protein